MRYAIILPVLAGLALALPRPQEMDIDAIEALPEPSILGPEPSATQQIVPYKSAAVVAAAVAAVTDASTPADPVKKRQASCALQSDGYGPATTAPDTADAFLVNPIYNSTASAAATPSGYSLAFGPQQGSQQQAGYRGLYTLSSYDPAACAAKCDGDSKCQAFNIYFERDPSIDPDCSANPPSFTNIKCTLYGYPVDGRTATNAVSYRGGADAAGTAFTVVMAGSNGYNKPFVASTLTAFTAPVSFPAAVNAPNDPATGVSSFIGAKTFETGAYDPLSCAVACQTQTAYNKAHPAKGATTYMPCNFFNAYLVTKNGAPQGTYCNLYTRTWDASYATNKGQTRSGNVYSNSESFGYSLATPDSGVL